MNLKIYAKTTNGHRISWLHLKHCLMKLKLVL